MSNDSFFYPQKMGRVMLLGLEEVIGKSGVASILDLGGLAHLSQNPPPAKADKTFGFEAVSQLHQSLEQQFGPRGGRGLALRAGRACFKYGIKEYGSLMGITEMAFRLLPLQTKLRVGAKSFADLFNKHTDQKVRLEETDEKIFWHIERCPLCWERKADEPICHLAVGLLQEALYWVSGGKVFNVEETACIAQGAKSCTIEIDKTPIS
ncbi:MAG: 4-vinyl reductase [Anaerolineales bacterium]|nr:4-vinyl reductase [Anaerolineales bacterium]